MPRIVRRLPLVMLAVCIVTETVTAPDELTWVPLGWELDPSDSPFDVSPDGIAFVVNQYEDDRRTRVKLSRVIQTSGSEILSQVDFDHSVVSVEYAPHQDMLLVHQWTPDPDTEAEDLVLFRVAALNRKGEVLWSRDRSRRLMFSTSGQVLYSLWAGILELVDLPGKKIREIDVRGRFPSPQHFGGSGILVVGSGEQVILSGSRILVSLDTTSTPLQEQWRLLLEDEDTDAVSLRCLAQDRFLVDQTYGRFLVADTEGSVIYRHFMESNVKDACGKRIGFNGCFVFPTESPDHLLLFAGRKLGMTIDLRNGTVGPCTFPIQDNSGYFVRRALAHGTLVLMSSTQVRVRAFR